MYGIYLKCDTCGATLGGEIFDPPLGPWDERKLATEARLRGWTGDLNRDSYTDKCPACAAASSACQEVSP